jgi:hypothetical protein
MGFGSKDEMGRIPWVVMHDPEGNNVLLLEANGIQ